MATPSPPATAVTSDRDALVALYEATDGANWTNSENWLSEQPLDEWWGVTTDGQGRVTNLVLWANQLHGALPPQLGDLAALEKLNIGGAARVEGAAANIWWLHQNHLRGPIPPQLGLLSNLRVLDLSGEEGNSLTGPIPVELGNLANLERLLLKGNQLRGPIPPELGRLVNLEEVRLGGSNQFTGCIPEAWHAVPENDLDELGLPFCADAPAPAGESLRATVAPSAGLNVRAGPDPSAAVVYVAPGGSDLQLSGGTQVVDGVTWWQLTDGHWVQGQFLKFG